MTTTSSLTKKIFPDMKDMPSLEKLSTEFSIKFRGNSNQAKKVKWDTKILYGSSFKIGSVLMQFLKRSVLLF